MKEIMDLLKRFVEAVETIAACMANPLRFAAVGKVPENGPITDAYTEVRDRTSAVLEGAPVGKEPEEGDDPVTVGELDPIPEAPVAGADGKVSRKEQNAYFRELLRLIQQLDPSYIPEKGQRASTLLKKLKELRASCGDEPLPADEPAKSETKEETQKRLIDEAASEPDEEDDISFEDADNGGEGETSDEPITFKDLRDITQECINKHTLPKVAPIATSFGKKLKDVPEEKYGEYMERMRTLLETGK